MAVLSRLLCLERGQTPSRLELVPSPGGQLMDRWNPSPGVRIFFRLGMYPLRDESMILEQSEDRGIWMVRTLDSTKGSKHKAVVLRIPESKMGNSQKAPTDKRIGVQSQRPKKVAKNPATKLTNTKDREKLEDEQTDRKKPIPERKKLLWFLRDAFEPLQVEVEERFKMESILIRRDDNLLVAKYGDISIIEKKRRDPNSKAIDAAYMQFRQRIEDDYGTYGGPVLSWASEKEGSFYNPFSLQRRFDFERRKDPQFTKLLEKDNDFLWDNFKQRLPLSHHDYHKYKKRDDEKAKNEIKKHKRLLSDIDAYRYSHATVGYWNLPGDGITRMDSSKTADAHASMNQNLVGNGIIRRDTRDTPRVLSHGERLQKQARAKTGDQNAAREIEEDDCNISILLSKSGFVHSQRDVPPLSEEDFNYYTKVAQRDKRDKEALGILALNNELYALIAKNQARDTNRHPASGVPMQGRKGGMRDNANTKPVHGDQDSVKIPELRPVRARNSAGDALPQKENKPTAEPPRLPLPMKERFYCERDAEKVTGAAEKLKKDTDLIRDEYPNDYKKGVPLSERVYTKLQTALNQSGRLHRDEQKMLDAHLGLYQEIQKAHELQKDAVAARKASEKPTPTSNEELYADIPLSQDARWDKNDEAASGATDAIRRKAADECRRDDELCARKYHLKPLPYSEWSRVRKLEENRMTKDEKAAYKDHRRLYEVRMRDIARVKVPLSATARKALDKEAAQKNRDAINKQKEDDELCERRYGYMSLPPDQLDQLDKLRQRGQLNGDDKKDFEEHRKLYEEIEIDLNMPLSEAARWSKEKDADRGDRTAAEAVRFDTARIKLQHPGIPVYLPLKELQSRELSRSAARDKRAEEQVNHHIQLYKAIHLRIKRRSLEIEINCLRYEANSLKSDYKRCNDPQEKQRLKKEFDEIKNRREEKTSPVYIASTWARADTTYAWVFSRAAWEFSSFHNAGSWPPQQQLPVGNSVETWNQSPGGDPPENEQSDQGFDSDNFPQPNAAAQEQYESDSDPGVAQTDEKESQGPEPVNEYTDQENDEVPSEDDEPLAPASAPSFRTHNPPQSRSHHASQSKPNSRPPQQAERRSHERAPMVSRAPPKAAIPEPESEPEQDEEDESTPQPETYGDAEEDQSTEQPPDFAVESDDDGDKTGDDSQQADPAENAIAENESAQSEGEKESDEDSRNDDVANDEDDDVDQESVNNANDEEENETRDDETDNDETEDDETRMMLSSAPS
ncbi:hypothetical protein B0H63DRAFT_506758 [Podospora didyma]|uniref:Uncharacterized protein n=1 Tax=Podospora didyma TaxID=330526 RepID=A0AAE0U9A3_9PEZI|nr:hypothetical protein B0H63DRAFT_506758 [Podospora didyma]